MGSSGGTTVVIIRIHLKKSFYLLLYSCSIPWSRTYAEVIKEQIKRNKRIQSPSFSQSFRFSALEITFRISFPLRVSNPVERTTPKQPLLGMLLISLFPRILFASSSCRLSLICKTSVPQNRIFCLNLSIENFLVVSSSVMHSLIWGTASPVKMDQFATHAPLNNKISQGTNL